MDHSHVFVTVISTVRLNATIILSEKERGNFKGIHFSIIN